jgi:hypothetical protein
MKKSLFVIATVCLGLVLSACQMLQNNENNRVARCKEIKSRMMFNGTTPSNQTQTFQDNQDQELLNKDYHEEDCT